MTSRVIDENNTGAVTKKLRDDKELPFPLPLPPADIENEKSNSGGWARVNNTLLDRFLTDIDKNGHNKDNSKSLVNETSQLDCLPPDVFVLICCSLTVRNIASLSECSKSLYVASKNQGLWRQKFKSRWNYNDPTIVDWSVAYRTAYLNPHDLWITHWNCVDPCDGLGPGRCCIKENKYHQTTNRRNKQYHKCPSCRFHPRIESKEIECYENSNAGSRTPITTPAQVIQAATNLRIEQSSHILPKPYSPTHAEHSFKRASTFHRSIDHHQYKEESLNFLNDLLFFHVHEDRKDNCIDDEPFETRDLKDYITRISENRGMNDRGLGQNPISDCNAFEPALHSWHLASICNPDYNHPVAWKILIQRSDSFTVFPSEGYLSPGESKVVTFGVKPLGSLIAHATHQLNVYRDGVDKFWLDLHEREARLPCTPFLLQYHYVSNIPCHLSDNDYQLVLQPSAQHQQSKCFHSPWQQCSLDQNQHIRSFFLQGHVHANYSLSEFRRQTLVPYSLSGNQISRTEKFLKRYLPSDQQSTYFMSPVVFCSPQLMEFYPSEWRRLQAMHLEEHRNDSALANKFRTESACCDCGLTWGPRMEELGNSFVLAKLEMELIFQQQRKKLLSIRRILISLVQQHRQFQRNSSPMKHQSPMFKQITIYLWKKVINYRGAPWLSREESRVLLQWEILLDLLSRSTTFDHGDLKRQRIILQENGGVYRYPTCTDSIYNQDDPLDRNLAYLLIDRSLIVWKDEPNHLKAFSRLEFGPGKFCFPHERYEILSARDNIPLVSQAKDMYSVVTDTFMNDQMCALKAAISVLADPRSLLIHGLFDEISFPGRIFRRPKMPVLPILNEERCLTKIRKHYQAYFQPFITSRAQLAYYELQESLDVQSILIVNSYYNKCFDFQAFSYPVSLRNFIQNIPAPGNGRFAFNTSKCSDTKKNSLDFQHLLRLGNCHTEVIELNFDENLHYLGRSALHERKTNVQNLSQDAPDGGNVHLRQFAGANNALVPRGPRIRDAVRFLFSQLGLRIDDRQTGNPVHVERSILIASHCLSLMFAILPLLVTLYARYFQLVPAQPISYLLHGLPYDIDNKMRFLSEAECGFTGLLFFLLCCILCRWIERYTDRNFMRAMIEHVRPLKEERSLCYKVYHEFLRRGKRIWDAILPLALQRLSFLSQKDRRKHIALIKYVSFWRSKNCEECRSTIQAVSGKSGISAEERFMSIHLVDHDSMKKKYFFTISGFVAGFTVSSPYYFLNLLAVFSCSVSLGISLSLRSIETRRSGFSIKSTGSVIKSLSYFTSIIFGLLIGQLVGSSGGISFLVEFTVTTLSIVLGGMGTMSGMRSWGSFFALSLVSSLGCMLGRCSVLDNIQKKKVGTTSIILCLSLCLVFSSLTLTFTGWFSERVVDLIVKRPTITHLSSIEYSIRSCQPTQLP